MEAGNTVAAALVDEDRELVHASLRRPRAARGEWAAEGEGVRARRLTGDARKRGVPGRLQVGHGSNQHARIGVAGSGELACGEVLHDIPPYMNSTRLHSSVSTATSWEMSSIAQSVRPRSSRSNESTCRCTVVSRAGWSPSLWALRQYLAPHLVADDRPEAHPSGLAGASGRERTQLVNVRLQVVHSSSTSGSG